MRHSPLIRSAVVATLLVAVVAASGCRWFRKDSVFQQSAETRPLEVPPDLDRPDTAGALGAPAAVSRSSMPAPAATATAATGFTMAGERDDVFNKVGGALATIEGVTVASKAQLLGTYDVNYAGSNFLVRVTKVDAGVHVSAVDPRGVAAGGEAPARLIAALKAAIGG